MITGYFLILLSIYSINARFTGFLLHMNVNYFKTTHSLLLATLLTVTVYLTDKKLSDNHRLDSKYNHNVVICHQGI